MTWEEFRTNVKDIGPTLTILVGIAGWFVKQYHDDASERNKRSLDIAKNRWEKRKEQLAKVIVGVLRVQPLAMLAVEGGAVYRSETNETTKETYRKKYTEKRWETLTAMLEAVRDAEIYGELPAVIQTSNRHLSYYIDVWTRMMTRIIAEDMHTSDEVSQLVNALVQDLRKLSQYEDVLYEATVKKYYVPKFGGELAFIILEQSNKPVLIPKKTND